MKASGAVKAQRGVRWIQKWVPKCPYDNNELRFRSNAKGYPEFFYSCPHCPRTWPITIENGEIVRTETSARNN